MVSCCMKYDERILMLWIRFQPISLLSSIGQKQKFRFIALFIELVNIGYIKKLMPN